jgi:hypothetical protein
VAAAPLGAARTLRASAGHQPHLGDGNGGDLDEPRQDRFSLLCLETTRSAPQLIRRWRRRSWIELVLRTLQHLLATEACQVRSEDAY